MSETGAAVPEPHAEYAVPLHQSLTQPILIMGVPRREAFLLGTAAAVIGIGLQVWWIGFPLWAVGHGVLAYLTDKDNHIFAVIPRHIRQPRYLDV